MSRDFWLLAFSISRQERLWEIKELTVLPDNVKYFFYLKSVIDLIRSLAPSSEALSGTTYAGCLFVV